MKVRGSALDSWARHARRMCATRFVWRLGVGVFVTRVSARPLCKCARRLVGVLGCERKCLSGRGTCVWQLGGAPNFGKQHDRAMRWMKSEKVVIKNCFNFNWILDTQYSLHIKLVIFLPCKYMSFYEYGHNSIFGTSLHTIYFELVRSIIPHLDVKTFLINGKR